MYKTFFGLRENPFNINPDPRFLCLTSRTQEALDQLTRGIQDRKGCVLLTGEVGTGKTTLVHYLLDWLRREKTPTAFIFNSHLSVNHLFDFILTEFGVPTDIRLRGNMLLQLTRWLLECFRAGRAPVLIVDEAQGLSFELLEEIRLLLNLETSTEKLLQIVLVGQPELEAKLKRPELRQFRQRIALRCSTAALTLEECCRYISDRLRIAGAAGGPVFTPRAVESLHFYSRGIPRVINILCEHALINAYAEQLNPVPVEIVEEAARDFLWEESGPTTASHSCGNRGSSKLAVMQSALTGELVNSLDVEARTSQQHICSTQPDARGGFVENVPGTNSFATSVPGHQEIPVSEEESQNEPVPWDDLASRMLEVETDDRERVRVEPLELSVDPVAGLVADMRRLLAAVSPISSLHVVPARSGGTPSEAATTTSVVAPVNAQPRIGKITRIPHTSVGATLYATLMLWKSQSSHWFTDLSCFISLAAWLRNPLADSPRIKEWASSIHVMLGRWVCDFKRDWAEMINSMRLLEMERSFRHWLRQPLAPNHWGHAKAMRLGSRRSVDR